MKTPRDILFQRHQNAVPKLDTVRESTVAVVCDRRGVNGTHGRWWRNAVTMIWHGFWHELVWPCRHIWAGLTAIWIMILAVNFSMGDHSQSVAGSSAPQPEMVLTWRQQEQLLAELIGPNKLKATAPAGRNALPPDRPKPSSPRFSSGRVFQMMTT